MRGSATNTATVTVNGNAVSRDDIVAPWTPWHYALDATNATSGTFTLAEIMAVINLPGTNTPDIVSSESGHIYAPPQQEALTYDDDGNLLSDGRFVYTWDGENRLIAVETRADLPTSVPRVKVTYSYDHQSRRIGKVVSNLESDTWTVAESRAFLYDSWNMIAETYGTNTTYYVWGLDLSGSRQGAGGVGGLLAVVKDSATYIPAYDANGNVTEYVSTNGTIASHYEYSPFGETVIQSGLLSNVFSFRFSTKYWEDEAK